jgi:hypothetical protein
LKLEFSNLDEYQRSVVRIYLAWLFIYGMWMRFWKGPGRPWPTVRVDVTNVKVREQADRCSPEDRDEHIFIQQSIRTRLVELYEKDALLEYWIGSLPQVRYNFQDGTSKIYNEPITDLLDRLMLGNECMGFAGNYTIETAYYLIVYMLGLNKRGAFDAFIAEMMPTILQFERDVVNSQLATIKNPNINDEVRRKYRILTERRDALAKPIPAQPIFEPAQVQANMHINN